MSWNTRCWAACVCSLLLPVGCAYPPRYRLPTLRYGSPAAAQKDYEQHDPFPDTTIGPPTGTRPRNADIQRSEPRRIRESTLPPWAGQPVPAGSGNPAPPPAASAGSSPVLP